MKVSVPLQLSSYRENIRRIARNSLRGMFLFSYSVIMGLCSPESHLKNSSQILTGSVDPPDMQWELHHNMLAKIGHYIITRQL